MGKKFRPGEFISLSRVTRKYACSNGVVTSKITLHSNGKKLYPHINKCSKFYNDLEMSSDPLFGDLSLPGYVIRCVDINGNYRETIMCTEGMVRNKSYE